MKRCIRKSNSIIVSYAFIVAFAWTISTALFAMADSISAANDSQYTGSWAQVPDIIQSVKPPVFPDKDFNIVDYGAKSGGEKDCREAIMSTIAACNKAGGGRVLVPKGIFKVDGPIHLDSNVNLHVAEGSKLDFGTDFSDYMPGQVLTRWECIRMYGYSPLIYAINKSNIALTGTGELNGNAKDKWTLWNDKVAKGRETLRALSNDVTSLEKRRFGEGYYFRPPMVQFYECRNILIENVNLKDSPFWCVHMVFSKNILIRNMRFTSLNKNNDGIDVDSCEDVYIHDVIFDNKDDNIAIKSGRGAEGRALARPSRNVVVQDCIFNTYTAVAVGSETGGGVQNVFVENCRAESELKRGLYIKSGSAKGGEVSHIRMRNIKLKNTRREMISFYTHYGEGEWPPYFHDVRYENIFFEGPGRIGLNFDGHEEQHIENIVLANISINGAKKLKEIKNTDNLVLQNVTINGELQQPNADNLPPDVYAGKDVVLEAGDTVTLNGNVSDDGKGKPTYKWSVVKGDAGSVKFAKPKALKTSASFSAAGDYIIKLTASDGKQSGYHLLNARVGSREYVSRKVKKLSRRVSTDLGGSRRI